MKRDLNLLDCAEGDIEAEIAELERREQATKDMFKKLEQTENVTNQEYRKTLKKI